MRFLHWFRGHKWTIRSAAFVPPTETTALWFSWDWDRKMARYGFTEIVEVCDCGARRFATILGNHSGLKSDSELADLEKMWR